MPLSRRITASALTVDDKTFKTGDSEVVYSVSEGLKMTLIDLFRQFHIAATSNRFPASARVLFYTLAGEWNEARRPANLITSRRNVNELTALPRTTFNDALRYLTDRSIIKTTTKGDTMSVTMRPSDTWRLAVKLPTAASLSSSNTKSNTETEKECAREPELETVMTRAALGTKYDGLTLEQMRAKRRNERDSLQRGQGDD